MAKVIGQIMEEPDYSRFHRLPDNRNVVESRVGKLVASISEKYILNPIIVNEKMEIIDGQGRYEALKRLGLPIHYIIAEGATSEDCRRTNKYNTKWSALDFAESYEKAGVESYVRLLKVCRKHGQPIKRVLRMANRGERTINVNAKNGMTKFEKGELTFTEEDAAKAERALVLANEILSALQFTDRPNDTFYVAVKICCETEGYEHARMIANCRRNRSTYAQMSGIDSQLKEFERIYNYKTHTQNRLYFSDKLRGKKLSSDEIQASYFAPYLEADVSSLVARERE